MSNPATDLLMALAALKLKRPDLRSTAEGTEIRSPGKPMLLLTYESAREFAQMIEEARHEQ